MKKTLFVILLFLLSARVSGESYKVEQLKFVSDGDTLSGAIVFPINQEIHSAVVFVHGSGMQTKNIEIAKRFAQDGIAALVYDKRGVGKSGGTYESKQSVSEHNITLLADDALSALNALSSHPELSGIPIGMAGISQAGWIVPLAAEKSRAIKFIVLWSAPVCKVSEEDIFSKYTTDLDGEKIPSYEQALKSRKQKYIWPRFLGKDSNPSDNLAKIKIPGLWIFGENDGSIPVDLSIQRLKELRSSEHKFRHVLFSDLGHNNMTDTFATATDWIKRLPK